MTGSLKYELKFAFIDLNRPIINCAEFPKFREA